MLYSLLSLQSSSNEVRKIQFTGRSTYMLSLPKRWMKEMDLKPGDLVNIVREANNSLSIMTHNGRTSNFVNEATALVLYNDGVDSLKRKIVSVSLAGYKIIHLKSKTGRINLLNVMQLEKLSAGICHRR